MSLTTAAGVRRPPFDLNDTMTDGLILALIFSAVLTVLGYKMRQQAVIFIGSLGWLISGLQVYQQTGEVLPMGLLIMIAFVSFFLVKRGE